MAFGSLAIRSRRPGAGQAFEPRTWLSNHSLLWNLAEKNSRIWMAQRKAKAKIGPLEVAPRALARQFRTGLAKLALTT